jgi:hypothetical protein
VSHKEYQITVNFVTVPFIVAVLISVFLKNPPSATLTPETTTRTSTDRQTTSKKHTVIRASLDQFQNNPVLANSQMVIMERPDRREFHFTNASTMGQNNAVVFHDDKKDGSIDRIVMILPFDSSDEVAFLESYAIAIRITQVASGLDGTKGFAQEFLKWFEGSIKEAGKTAVAKWFGDVSVGLRIMAATDGFVAVVTIGEDNIPKKGQQEI